MEKISKLVSPFKEPLRRTAEAVQNCPNCKEDRKIQNKYEKIVLQPRETEALEKRIVELEAELKRRKHETPPDRENEEVCFPKDASLKKIAELEACVEQISPEKSWLLEKVEELQKAFEIVSLT